VGSSPAGGTSPLPASGARPTVWRRARRLVRRIGRSAPARLIQRYVDAKLPNLAAAVAFHTLFSLFPLLLALVTLIGLILPDPSRLEQAIAAAVYLFPPEASEQLLVMLRGTRENAGLLGLLSVLGLLYSGSALFGSLEDAFDRIYQLPGRPYVRQKLMATGMLLTCALLLLLSLMAASLADLLGSVSGQAVETWLPGAAWLGELIDLRAVGVSFAWTLSLAWSFLFFLLIYAIVPNRRFSPRQIWPGAALAAILFVGITELFPVYLDYFGNFNRYGAGFALVLLLLAWFYFLAHVMLFGATVNAFIEEAPQRARRARRPFGLDADTLPGADETPTVSPTRPNW
jgi:membrane protein